MTNSAVTDNKTSRDNKPYQDFQRLIPLGVKRKIIRITKDKWYSPSIFNKFNKSNNRNTRKKMPTIDNFCERPEWNHTVMYVGRGPWMPSGLTSQLKMGQDQAD